MKKILFLVLCSASLGVLNIHAQEVYQDLKEEVTAEVTEVIKVEEREIIGTDTFATVQQIEAKLTSGTTIGRVVTFESEMVILEVGDAIYLNHVVLIDDTEYFVFKDFKRHTQLSVLIGFFIGLLVLFSGWHGMRALLSLALSIAAIIFILVPLMLRGYDAVLVSLSVSAVVLALVLFLTHGYNARSGIAFCGTFAAVLVTCLIAWLSVSSMRLTGFGSDASVSLNFATRGTLDFAGLLLGSIIIGILGMLDDVSITQVSVVQQLKHANASFGPYELYKRAIIVGKDHIGSLVNTLALAYVGISLPLVLLFANADATLGLTLNQEVVASELVRIIVGSIGLILAVPLTTVVAAWYFGKHTIDEKDILLHDHGHEH